MAATKAVPRMAHIGRTYCGEGAESPSMRPVPRAPVLGAAFLALLMSVTPLAAADSTDLSEFFPNACRDVDPMAAVATGYANPLTVILNGESLEPDLLETGVAQATQAGPGKAGNRTALLEVNVPDEDDPLVSAELLAGRVDLDVDGPEDGLEAEAWSQARVAHLDVGGGLITADLVRGFAYARTDVRSARTYTDPSTILNLKVAGISQTDVSPGANVTLPESLFGPGSWIAVYDRVDHSSIPTEDFPFYVADSDVTMLRVHITEMVLVGQVEVIVSQVHSRAVSPTPFCGLSQTVEAGAYTARVRQGLDDNGADGSNGVLVGEQHIGVTGGSGHQQLLGQTLDLAGAVDARINVTETDVTGTIEEGVASDAHSMSQVLGVCIRLDTNTSLDDCFIKATVVRAEVTCHADAEGAHCEGGTKILELIVAGVDVCAELGLDDTCEPDEATDDPNLDIAGVQIWLNQQERMESDGYASLYVRAIRIETPLPQLETVIIGRAYASASFEHAGTGPTDAWTLK